jgi:hypothetical protein
VPTAVPPTPLPLDAVATAPWTRARELRLRSGSSSVEASGLATHQPHAHRRLRRILGATLVDIAHRRLGRVEDVVIDCEAAKIAHVLLSFGGFLGLGRQRALVHADGLRARGDAPDLVLPLTRERLAAAALPGPPHMADATWLATVCSRLEANAAPASTTTPGAVRSVDAEEDERARAAHGFAGLEERLHGTVVAMESSSRQRRGVPRQRVRLRTDTGREVTVLLAALEDVAQAALRIRVGQVATVRGWWAGQGAQSILVARAVTVDGRTIAIDDVPRNEIWMPQ